MDTVLSLSCHMWCRMCCGMCCCIPCCMSCPSGVMYGVTAVSRVVSVCMMGIVIQTSNLVEKDVL